MLLTEYRADSVDFFAHFLKCKNVNFFSKHRFLSDFVNKTLQFALRFCGIDATLISLSDSGNPLIVYRCLSAFNLV